MAASSKQEPNNNNNNISMIFHASKASSRRWIARMFSLYRAEIGDKLTSVPEVPEVLDLCEQVVDASNGKKGARYRVVATTAPTDCLNGKMFAKMIAAQKASGTLRKNPTNQLWALRDNKTRHVWICSPDVFVNMTDSKSKPAKNRHSNLFRVFPTLEAMRQIATARQEYLNGDKPRGKGTSLASITQEMIAIAKKQDKDATMVGRDEDDEEDAAEDLRDYSIQVAPGVYMPVCSTAFLHNVQPDVSEPVVYDETAKPAPKRRPAAKMQDDDEGKPAKSSKSRRAKDDDDDDDDDEEMSDTPKKRQRRPKDSDDEEEKPRAKRGCELSSVGAIVNPDDDDGDTEIEDESETSSSIEALGRCIKQISKLIPADLEKDTPVELHRAVSDLLKTRLPKLSKDACEAVCKHLNTREYDNSELVKTDPDNPLSVLRAKTGVPDDLMVPAWAWPMLLHFEQHNDADIRAYLVSAQSLLARASRDWAVQTTRPMTSSQMPKDWSPLFNAKLCEQAAMLSCFEQFVASVLSKHVDELADRARDVVVEHRQMTKTVAVQAAKIDDLQRQLEELSVQEQTNLAKIDELEARLAAAPKALSLSLPPKKASVVDPNDF